MFEQMNMFEQMQTSPSEIDCVCMDISAEDARDCLAVK